MNSTNQEQRLLWVDMEMTGLDPAKERILEVAAIVTDSEFNSLTTYEAVVFQPQELLDLMDDWCKKTHSESGLITKVAQGISEDKVDEQLTKFCKDHISSKQVVLCGNSIGQDRKFIDKYLPQFSACLHYRMIDVSSFKEVFKRKYRLEFKKEQKHRALDDILESIAELKYYCNFINVESK